MVHSQNLRPASSFVDDEESLQLTDKINNNQLLLSSSKPRLSRIFTYSRIYVSSLHALVIILAWLLWYAHRVNPCMVSLAGQSWSPVEEYIQYEIRDSYDKNSHYAGIPSPENKLAWNTLAKPIYFNASAEDLERAGVPMENRTRMEYGGYLSSLGVLHEMHCLRMFRYFIYFDHFYHNVTDVQFGHIQAHLDHCLDNIRSSLMCHPNTKMITFNWNKPERGKPEHESNSKSFCVQWKSIENWGNSVGVTDSPPIIRVAPFVD